MKQRESFLSKPLRLVVCLLLCLVGGSGSVWGDIVTGTLTKASDLKDGDYVIIKTPATNKVDNVSKDPTTPYFYGENTKVVSVNDYQYVYVLEQVSGTSTFKLRNLKSDNYIAKSTQSASSSGTTAIASSVSDASNAETFTITYPTTGTFTYTASEYVSGTSQDYLSRFIASNGSYINAQGNDAKPVYCSTDKKGSWTVWEIYTLTEEELITIGYCYNVTLSTPTNGTIAFDGLTSSTTSKKFVPGTAVTVKATPSTGYEVDTWTYGSTTQKGGTSFTFTPTAEGTVTCTFKQSSKTITYKYKSGETTLYSYTKTIEASADVPEPETIAYLGYTQGDATWDESTLTYTIPMTSSNKTRKFKIYTLDSDGNKLYLYANNTNDVKTTDGEATISKNNATTWQFIYDSDYTSISGYTKDGKKADYSGSGRKWKIYDNNEGKYYYARKWLNGYSATEMAWYIIQPDNSLEVRFWQKTESASGGFLGKNQYSSGTTLQTIVDGMTVYTDKSILDSSNNLVAPSGMNQDANSYVQWFLEEVESKDTHKVTYTYYIDGTTQIEQNTKDVEEGATIPAPAECTTWGYKNKSYDHKGETMGQENIEVTVTLKRVCHLKYGDATLTRTGNSTDGYKFTLASNQTSPITVQLYTENPNDDGILNQTTYWRLATGTGTSSSYFEREYKLSISNGYVITGYSFSFLANDGSESVSASGGDYVTASSTVAATASATGLYSQNATFILKSGSQWNWKAKVDDIEIEYEIAAPEDITLSAQNKNGYWATYSDASNLTLIQKPADSEMNVYKMIQNGTTMKMSALDTKSATINGTTADVYVVPASMGVLIKTPTGTNTASTWKVSTTEGTVPTDNLLHGYSVDMSSETGYTFYKLAYGNWTGNVTTSSGLGFWWGADNGAWFSSTKGAYLAKPSTVTGARGFSFDDMDVVTGLRAIEETTPATNSAVYNLAGQRVNATTRGITIINGKKVIR